MLKFLFLLLTQLLPLLVFSDSDFGPPLGTSLTPALTTAPASGAFVLAGIDTVFDVDTVSPVFALLKLFMCCC